MPKKTKTAKKSIGLDIEPPKKECEDKNCAWHGQLPVRGKVFQGVVTSDKAHSTVTVEFGYHSFVPKYERYERRKSRIPAHNPSCIQAKKGDRVIIAECRPISKTKSFVVVGKEEGKGEK